MKIDIEMLKKLREVTGAGVGDCRAALEETQGNYDKALEILKKKAMDKAAKKAEREVKSGRIFSYVHHTGRVGCMVALACETDFVAKTEDFGTLGKEIALQIASNRPESVDELLTQEYIRDSSKTIADLVKAVIGKLGENIQVIEFKVVAI